MILANVKAVATSPSVSTYDISTWWLNSWHASKPRQLNDGCIHSGNYIRKTVLTLSSVPVGKKGRTKVKEPTNRRGSA